MITKQNRYTLEQLEAMSPEELDELMAVADEMIESDTTVNKYVPNIIQEAVHKAGAFIRCLFSGNGVGKTTACINEAIWTATGTHPTRESSRLPNTTIIVLDDASKADSVYVMELKKRKWYDVTRLEFDKKGKAHTQEIRFPNGSNIVFMSHQMDEEKFESIQAAAVIFDEPPPRKIYIALLRGQREKDMKPWIIFAGTPRGRNAPWMYKELYRPWLLKQDDEIECFFGSTYDNLQNLEAGTIERWEKRFTKEELETRLYGKFEFLSGAIFEFKREVHVVEPFPWPKQWPVIVAVDPHLRKDHVAVIIGVSPDQELYVLKELTTGLAGRKACAWFIQILMKSGYNVKASICDNFGSVDMYEDQGSNQKKSFIKMWNEEAIRVRRPKLSIRPTTKAEKKDDEWIEDMQDLLRIEETQAGPRPQFMVFSHCVGLIDNFETYIWDEHTGKNAIHNEPKEAPLGTNQDYLMCVKYGIAMKPIQIVKQSRIYSNWRKPAAQQEYENTEHKNYKRPWEKD